MGEPVQGGTRAWLRARLAHRLAAAEMADLDITRDEEARLREVEAKLRADLATLRAELADLKARGALRRCAAHR